MTTPSRGETAASDHLLTPMEVAALLYVHLNTVKRTSPDDLPFVRVNHRGDRRYRLSDVQAYVARMTARWVAAK